MQNDNLIIVKARISMKQTADGGRISGTKILLRHGYAKFILPALHTHASLVQIENRSNPQSSSNVFKTSP